MKRLIGAVSGLGTAAVLFIVVWTMILGSWIIYAIVEGKVEISAAAAGIITGFLALPYTFINLIDKRFPRKETANGNSESTKE